MRPFSIAKLSTALASLLALGAVIFPRPADAFTPDEGKAPMTVTLVRSDAAHCGTNCPEWLALTGRIVSETPVLLRGVLGRLGPRKVPVLVDSPGGDVDAAMRMGRMIRERRLDIAVAGTAFSECAVRDRACLSRHRAGERPGFVAGGIHSCASACVLILAAGMDRSVAQDSYVGVHQMIGHKTFIRTMNMFRIMRKVVGGRIVEVSRTLIASRPVSSRTVQTAASEQKYSEVDRYLLKMGISESIMPLMRGAPPTGMHWMLPVELATTRIATDTTDARTLVARSVPTRDVRPAPLPEPEPASLTTPYGSDQNGTVTWRFSHTTVASSDPPMLMADIELPDRMHGALLITRNTDPSKAASFVVAARFSGPVTAASTLRAPKVCDAENCSAAVPLSGTLVSQAYSDYVFWVDPGEGDRFLSALRDRNWLTLPVKFANGGLGELGLTLSGTARRAILDWEQWCCGLSRPVTLGPTGSFKEESNDSPSSVPGDQMSDGPTQKSEAARFPRAAS